MSLESVLGKKYKLTSSENFDEFMKALGMDMMVRKVAASLHPILDLSKSGDEWCITSVTSFKTTTLKFKDGVAFEQESIDGRKVTSTITINGMTMFEVQKDAKGKATTFETVFSEDSVKMVIKKDDIVCTRMYKLHTVNSPNPNHDEKVSKASIHPDEVAMSACQLSCTSENTPEHVLDYYWRDYVGIIPHDAVPGGRDKVGRTTYIGQVYTKDKELLPATIYSGCKSALASAYNVELQSHKNVKILCSNNILKLKWVVTEHEKIHLLTNYHFVIGGFELGYTLNIGRVNHGGEIIIGKIFNHPSSSSLKGLAIPYNGEKVPYFSYEILAYKI